MNQIRLVKGDMLDGHSPEDEGTRVPADVLRRGIGIFLVEDVERKDRDLLLRRIRAAEEMVDVFAGQVYGKAPNNLPPQQIEADSDQLSKFAGLEWDLAAQLARMDNGSVADAGPTAIPEASHDEREYWQSLAA